MRARCAYGAVHWPGNGQEVCPAYTQLHLWHMVRYHSLYSFAPRTLAHWLFYNWGFSKKLYYLNSISLQSLPSWSSQSSSFSLLLFFLISDYFKICIRFVLKFYLFSPGESEHSQVIAKHGAQKSVPPPDAKAWRKIMGSSRRVHPSWNEGSRWLSDTDYASHHLHLLFQAQWIYLWAPCRSHCHWGLCSETYQTFLASPCLQEHALILLLLLISVCTQGRRMVTGLLPCSSLLPLPSLLLRPSVSICSAPPEWDWPSLGAWETMSLPSHERQVFADSNAVFNQRACFEDLVSVIVPEACVCHEGCTNTKVSEIWGEKINEKTSLLPLTHAPEATAGFQVAIRNVGTMKFPRINVIHRWAWCYL